MKTIDIENLKFKAENEAKQAVDKINSDYQPTLFCPLIKDICRKFKYKPESYYNIYQPP